MPLPEDLKQFVESSDWTFARTYARTWPHEYIVRNHDNAALILRLARHILHHGVDGRFYSQLRPYHHEDGMVYWVMDSNAEDVTVVNRCGEHQTFEARQTAGTLPGTT